jgi:excisionase family DNA binding protein
MTIKFDQFFTVSEVSERLRISPSFVYKLAHEHKIPATRVGGRIVFSIKAIEEYLTSRTTGRGGVRRMIKQSEEQGDE